MLSFIHNFFYDDLIYIHTTHIFILISPFKDGKDAERAPTIVPRKSNWGEIGGIFACGDHT